MCLPSITTREDESPAALDDLDAEELLIQTMNDRQRLAELGKLIGVARYALEGHDTQLLQETKRRMQRITAPLPDKYRSSDLIAAAVDSSDKGSRLAELYLERGYKDADEFIKKHIVSKLDDILATGSWRDPKSHLQEVSQRIDGQTPVYRVLSEEGPDHDKVFQLGVYVGDKLMGKGSGSSKQNAQQEAAKAALAAYEKRKSS